MQEEHRKAIQNNFKSLVEQTDLDTMVTNLYEKGVFSSQMIEKYKVRFYYYNLINENHNTLSIIVKIMMTQLWHC